jgi:hypothetical protein
MSLEKYKLPSLADKFEAKAQEEVIIPQKKKEATPVKVVKKLKAERPKTKIKLKAKR